VVAGGFFNDSKSRLSGPANHLSPVFRRSQNTGLESLVMILPGVSMVEMTKKERRRLRMENNTIGG